MPVKFHIPDPGAAREGLRHARRRREPPRVVEPEGRDEDDADERRRPGPQARYHSEGIFVKKAGLGRHHGDGLPASDLVRDPLGPAPGGQADVWYEKPVRAEGTERRTELTKTVSTGPRRSCSTWRIPRSRPTR